MRQWWCLAAACFAALLLNSKSSAQPAARVIPDERYREEVTNVAVPGKPGVTYVIRRVVNCKNANGACEVDRASSRLRLEDSTGFGRKIYFDADPARNPTIPIGFVVSPTLYLTQVKSEGGGERVVQVSLPDGRVLDDRTYESWFRRPLWSAPSAMAILMTPFNANGPRPFAILDSEGRITQVTRSDWNRLRENRPDFPECAAASIDAAFPPESMTAFLAGRPYLELQRRASTGGRLIPPDLAATGTPDAICARYQTHFWIGRRSDGSGWQALVHGGRVLANGATFATAAEAEQVGIEEMRAREMRASAVVEQQDRIRRNNEEMAARRAQTLAVLRPRIEALWNAGAYAEALAAAQDLPAEEYAAHVLKSPIAALNDYKRGFEQLRLTGHNMNSPLAQRLQARVDGLNACSAKSQPPVTARSRWESMAPYDQSMLILRGPPSGNRTLGPGERYVFDATAFEWRIVYGPSTSRSSAGYEVVNVPRPRIETPQERAAREAELQRCVAAVRAQ